MKLDIPFITHYHGNTNKAPKVMERLAWATTQVDVDDMRLSDFTVVLQDDVRLNEDFEGRAKWLTSNEPFGDRVYAFGGRYWASVNAVNAYTRGDVGSFSRTYSTSKKSRYGNFNEEQKERFAWNTFGFRFFGRFPCPYVFTIDHNNVKSYRPGGNIVWDDTPVIMSRVRKWCEANLVIADDIVLCRIEPPCFTVPEEPWRNGRIYTPWGGYGAADIVYDDRPLDTDLLKDIRAPGWRDAPTPHSDAMFFDPVPDIDEDPLERTVRALFSGLFQSESWLDRQDGSKRTKSRAKSLSELHALWLSSWNDSSEQVVDDAVEMMLPLAAEGRFKDALERWRDRPIGV